jgi:regulatory protein
MDVFSEIDESEYCQILSCELQKKYKTIRGNAVEIRGKLFRFAAGRGFEQEMIHDALSKLVP